jgi:hypothetical protein
MPRPRKRVLELRCGVGSLQQVPGGTPTGERIPLDARLCPLARHHERMRLPAFRFPFCFLSSLRAKRSNPAQRSGRIGLQSQRLHRGLDCFVALLLAMTPGTARAQKNAPRERVDLSVDRDADVAEYDPRNRQQ